MLAERTEYLSSGVHIGMKSCTAYLKEFVYKIRDDGLAVFNLKKVDERITAAADFLSRFDNVLLTSRKSNASEAINKFAEVTGSKAISGRFSPGTLTNPSYRDFFEPDVVMVVDPLVDWQSIKEAKKKRIPVISLCDTFNEASDIDLIIPTNNNGKKAIALILMLLAREILKKRGEITKDADFRYTVQDFGSDKPVAEETKEQKEETIKEKDGVASELKKEILKIKKQVE